MKKLPRLEAILDAQAVDLLRATGDVIGDALDLPFSPMPIAPDLSPEDRSLQAVDAHAAAVCRAVWAQRVGKAWQAEIEFFVRVAAVFVPQLRAHSEKNVELEKRIERVRAAFSG